MMTLVKHDDRFIQTEIDDEIVLMDLDSGNFFSLTGSAAAIWMLIDGSRDRDTILALLCSEFACEPSAITADLDDFLGQISGVGFVTGG